MRAESTLSQLQIVQMKGQTAHFGPRFPVHNSAVFGDYFTHPLYENMDVSIWEKTEAMFLNNSLLSNIKYRELSVDKLRSSCRWECDE
jgi:hypothetical protein